MGRSLTAALWALACTRSNFALLDGTLARTHRIRVHDRRYYAGKHRRHGVNRQGLTDPYRRLIWIFDGLPGSTHDRTAPAPTTCSASPTAPGSTLYADKGYAGDEGPFLLTPYKGRSLPDSYRQANRCHTAVRANGERGFAVLKSWKVFDRFRGCPRHVGAHARAVLTLEHGPQ